MRPASLPDSPASAPIGLDAVPGKMLRPVHIELPGEVAGEPPARSASHVAAAGTAALAEGIVGLDGVEMYRVPDLDRVGPFLMTLTSPADLWMFLSSTGGLTAGRMQPDHGLFPYETEDRLHHLHGVTGPITLLRVHGSGGGGSGGGADTPIVWEPFAPHAQGPTAPRRVLYRSLLGSQVVFEERPGAGRGTGLVFRYRWAGSDELGFVRTASLENTSGETLRVELLDGLLNLLPSGVPLALQQSMSCLADAYKRADLEPQSSLAVYSLTAPIGDRPDPGEVLTATTVWKLGLPDARVLLSPDAVTAFRRGESPTAGTTRLGGRCAYLCHTTLTLAPGQRVEWHLVADVDQTHAQIAARLAKLRVAPAPGGHRAIEAALAASDAGLARNIAACDGGQHSADRVATARHGLNVLLNNMRGGVPLSPERIASADFVAFVRLRNATAAETHRGFLSGLPAHLSLADIVRQCRNADSPDLVRLALEYLPLTFGRRHGDPSRPWNLFTIRLRDEQGNPRVAYQGNWRDIFQNWEALSLSYPGLLPHLVAKFVNASTFDGFNPYRLTSDGIEWEVDNPDEPWSHLGYWGDHQIVYLLRLLQRWHEVDPAGPTDWLCRPVFSFANVPYQLRSYAEICKDPRRSIRFDTDRDRHIASLCRRFGSDGKLVLSAAGNVHHVTLLEKLLIPLLSKVCNLVPGGGIWLNTQRPEWNDANNALAGWGLSVVTVAHLHRYTVFLQQLLSGSAATAYELSPETLRWLTGTLAALSEATGREAHDPIAARRLLDRLGAVFQSYRDEVYPRGFSAAVSTGRDVVDALLRRVQELTAATLAASRRPDGLYHGYNTLRLLDTPVPSLAVDFLDEMLEGQVALLSSGFLSPGQTCDLAERLFDSRLFRPDVGSFLLYPQTTLESFFDRNALPAIAEEVPLVRELLAAGDTSVVLRDATGRLRFHPSLIDAGRLSSALAALGETGRFPSIAAGTPRLLDLYEQVFAHRRFTGRSGRMYAYEGLGCIYWHMVGKLLVALQEAFWHEVDLAGPNADRLARVYYKVRDGLGFNRTAAQAGAVPIEPYSHTPAAGGSRQPGMTGQVKEEILTRRGELGVRLFRGAACFDPRLLRKRELFTAPTRASFLSLDGTQQSLDLPAGSLAFTVCQVPVVYRFGHAPQGLTVHFADGRTQRFADAQLPRHVAAELFARSGHVRRLEVGFSESLLTLP